tara:strand:- start:3211 stop:3708 length:498 start_codon:yes stop_codon:yes gene_type:complete
METAIWQNFDQNQVILVGISNTNNSSIINDFVEENSLTFPILYDSGSSGGVQGGDTYDLYYMPNDGSPYPRDFVINQEGAIVYANNEIDTEWMLYEIYNLIDSSNGIAGDINQDDIVNVLDIIKLISFILGTSNPSENELVYSDLNQDGIINILDVVSLVNLILN